MVIVQLTGGLGNQLFQYAMGRVLSYHSSEKLYVDISSYTWDTLRTYALDTFNIQVEVVSKSEIERVKRLKPVLKERLKERLTGQKIPYYKYPHIKEQSFEYDANYLLFRKKNIYLEGYWQSERYFKEIRSLLLDELSVSVSNWSLQAQQYKVKIEHDLSSVSIHVRRGDYVSNTETNDFHGLCDVAYYQYAIQKIFLDIPNPTFYIFSDDKDYVKEIFQEINNVVYIDNIPSDFEELLLMSYCKHNIIANSSFSWWGAWLNKNTHKVVIAPSSWFSNNLMNQKTKDLLPQTWKKI